MLVLTRRSNERIMIGDDIEVVVLEVRANSVRLGINAPQAVPVVRTEIFGNTIRDHKQQDEQESCESTKLLSLIPTATEISDQLLHQFCERRRTWQLPEAAQALCISAFANFATAGSIVGLV